MVVERYGRIRQVVRGRVARKPLSSLVSFGEDACGRVYAVSFFGDVFRLTRSHRIVTASWS